MNFIVGIPYPFFLYAHTIRCIRCICWVNDVHNFVLLEMHILSKNLNILNCCFYYI